MADILTNCKAEASKQPQPILQHLHSDAQLAPKYNHIGCPSTHAAMCFKFQSS